MSEARCSVSEGPWPDLQSGPPPQNQKGSGPPRRLWHDCSLRPLVAGAHRGIGGVTGSEAARPARLTSHSPNPNCHQTEGPSGPEHTQCRLCPAPSPPCLLLGAGARPEDAHQAHNWRQRDTFDSRGPAISLAVTLVFWICSKPGRRFAARAQPQPERPGP